jgi:quinol monooxygenase YgiN
MAPASTSPSARGPLTILSGCEHGHGGIHQPAPPADGKRDALIGLLREFADSIHADPESLHYSVHEPVDDEAALLTVIQAYTSVAGFEKHGEWMAPNIPRLVALLASPPDPLVLLRWVSLGGDPKELFSA